MLRTKEKHGAAFAPFFVGEMDMDRAGFTHFY